MVQLGDIIGGKYCLAEQIDEGGMATIWRAVHMDLDRPVAVKFLRAVGLHAEELRKRFEREARTAASVRHRNVVDIIDFGQTEAGTPYIVMELLDGHTLGRQMDLGLTAREAARIVASALRGLAAVHDAGIVHRDLKPENIFLARDGDEILPKLLDFGISKVEEASSRGRGQATRDGFVMGTPDYMSPEQARGIKKIDRRTDIFSMGVILFEALAGKLPFTGEAPNDIIVHLKTEKSPRLSDVRPDLPASVSAVIERALEREPGKRWADAREMREALLAAADDLSAGDSGRPTSEIPPPMAMPERITPAPAEVRPRAPSPAMGVDADADAPGSAGRRRGAVAAAALLAVGLAVGGGLLGRSALEPSGQPVASADDPPPAVRVTLRGLPEGASVTVNGRPITDNPVTLRQSPTPRLIEVMAPGHAPWRVSVAPTEDIAYDVELTPLSAEPDELEAAPRPRSRAATEADARPVADGEPTAAMEARVAHDPVREARTEREAPAVRETSTREALAAREASAEMETPAIMEPPAVMVAAPPARMEPSSMGPTESGVFEDPDF